MDETTKPEITPAVVETPKPAPAKESPTTPDPVAANLLTNILGLIDDKEKPQHIRSSRSYDEDDDEEDEKPKPTTPPAKPAPAAPEAAAPKTAQEPAKEPEKKVQVKSRPKVDLREEVKKAVAEEVKLVVPAKESSKEPAKETPAAPEQVAKPDDADLTPEEKDELELATFAESRDPSKKGLTDKLRAFYKANKEYIEKATAKASEEGEDYDPTRDPAYKKFLQANEPKLSALDRKQLFKEKIASEAREAALKEAEAKFSPKFSELERKTRELEHRPVIESRVNSFIDEVAVGMPEEVVKFYNENGQDVEKTRAEFPLEFEIITKHLNGATTLAKELLEVRNGLKAFEPEKNDRHRFLRDFVNQQGDVFERAAREHHVRDGKTFVHPSKFRPELADKHWTFSNDDVLAMLKYEAQTGAKRVIRSEMERLKGQGFVRSKPASAPNGAAPAAKKEPESSPRTPSAPLPGAGAASSVETNPLLRVLPIPGTK